MAKRSILEKEDKTLYKKSRQVTEFNGRLHQLIDDMRDTLMEAGGVGLAAPQVGVLRNVVIVIETNVENEGDEYIIELVNPEIIQLDGEQSGPEGCLSFPGEYGIVKRPQYVTVRAQDRNGKTFQVEGEGLTARCFCHEIDHLTGTVFTAKCDRMLTSEELQNGEV